MAVDHDDDGLYHTVIGYEGIIVVIAIVVFLSPAVAVTFVVPACAPAFTRPVSFTLAIAESELV